MDMELSLLYAFLPSIALRMTNTLALCAVLSVYRNGYPVTII